MLDARSVGRRALVLDAHVHRPRCQSTLSPTTSAASDALEARVVGVAGTWTSAPHVAAEVSDVLPGALAAAHAAPGSPLARNPPKVGGREVAIARVPRLLHGHRAATSAPVLPPQVRGGPLPASLPLPSAVALQQVPANSPAGRRAVAPGRGQGLEMVSAGDAFHPARGARLQLDMPALLDGVYLRRPAALADPGLAREGGVVPALAAAPALPASVRANGRTGQLPNGGSRGTGCAHNTGRRCFSHEISILQRIQAWLTA